MWLAVCRPAGVEEHVQMDIGVPQKPGRPCCFRVNIPAERPDYQLQVRRPACGGDGSYESNRKHTWYCQATRTEARQDEQQGIGAS